MSNDTPMSFDDIDVSGVAAAPSMDTPPAGSYIVLLSMEQKIVADKRAISANCVLEDVIELGEQHTEKPANPGQQFNTLYFIDKPERVPYVKRDLAVFFDSLGTQSVNTMVAGVQNIRCKIICNYSRDDYFRIQSFEIL
jgi:hypothetical protein